MTTETAAIVCTKIEGTTVTDDGKHMLLKFENGVTLAIPTGELQQLMALTAQSAGQAAQKLGADPAVKLALPVDWWEFGKAQEGRTVTTFRVPGGLELSFLIPEGAELHMIEALQSILGHVANSDGETKH